jgi:hypothetical protein
MDLSAALGPGLAGTPPVGPSHAPRPRPCAHAGTSTPPDLRPPVAPSGRGASAFPMSRKGRRPDRVFRGLLGLHRSRVVRDQFRPAHLPADFLRRLSPGAPVAAFRLHHRLDSYPALATRTGAGLSPAGRVRSHGAPGHFRRVQRWLLICAQACAMPSGATGFGRMKPVLGPLNRGGQRHSTSLRTGQWTGPVPDLLHWLGACGAEPVAPDKRHKPSYYSADLATAPPFSSLIPHPSSLTYPGSSALRPSPPASVPHPQGPSPRWLGCGQARAVLLCALCGE